MKKVMEDVAEFHHATDTPVLGLAEVPDGDRVILRKELIEEEFYEVMQGLGFIFERQHNRSVQYCDPDLVDLADGLADLIYVVAGTALEFGIPLERVWNEVQASNMTKVDPETGKVMKREDGKVLKGPNFVPPDIEGILRYHNA